MAGYQQDYSMSNNARLAYEFGYVPASKVSGIPAALVRKHVPEEEWHHTSKMYNKTSFYNPHRARVIFGLEDHTDSCVEDGCDELPDAEAISDLAESKSRRTEQAVEHFPSTVRWTEFSRRYGGYVSAVNHEVHGVKVIVKGNWAHVELPNGITMRKKIDGKHFTFYRGIEVTA